MADRNGDWICTYTGRQFWPLDPRPEDVCIEDIAHALSLICRFTGHVKTFYSVAEHSVRVAKQAYDSMQPGGDRIITVLWGMLHDAPEAYLCDVARPVKRSPEMAAYRKAEHRLMSTIARAFGVNAHKDHKPGSDPVPPIIQQIDEVLLITEARDLMNGFDDRWYLHREAHRALPETIVPWQPEYAEAMFLQHFRYTMDSLSQWRVNRAESENAKKAGVQPC